MRNLSSSSENAERLAEALRENLKKRKNRSRKLAQNVSSSNIVSHLEAESTTHLKESGLTEAQAALKGPAS